MSEPFRQEKTDPGSYWAKQVDKDLVVIKDEIAGIKKTMWRPVFVLAGSALGVVLALGAFGLWTVNRDDAGRADNSAAIQAAKVELGAVDAQLRADFQRHQADEEHSRDRIERKVDKLIDVIVEEKRPAVVRAAP